MIHRASTGHLFDGAVRLHLAGCGGNGSLMLSGLARLDHAMRALGHPGLRITVWDPDNVSQTNVGRQLFFPADVGRNKAVMLVHRVNQCFGSQYSAHAAAYNDDAIREGIPNLLITCVDSASARTAIGDAYLPFAKGGRGGYWLDLGNRAADGQVVLGYADSQWPVDDGGNRQKKTRQPAGSCNLPNVLDLFPEIAAGTVADDDAPSCSLAEALTRQQLFINQFVVTEALEILWKLLRFAEIDYHGAFVNLNPRSTTRLPIDAEVWRRFGWPRVKPAKFRKPQSKGKKS